MESLEAVRPIFMAWGLIGLGAALYYVTYTGWSKMQATYDIIQAAMITALALAFLLWLAWAAAKPPTEGRVYPLETAAAQRAIPNYP